MEKLAQQRAQLGGQSSITQDPNQQREKDDLEARINELEERQFSLQELSYRYYPKSQHTDQVMPTRLGNILKNAELYPLDRYNIDAVLVWPRLYHSLPDRFIQLITEARSSLDFSLAIATLSLLFSTISGFWLMVAKAPGWLFLLCFWGGALVAWFSYRSALSNTAAYAEQVKVCFDLYRKELVKQLRLKPAITPDAEKQQWQEIRKLFYAGQAPSTWQYIDSEQKTESTQNA